jgi:limonene-1,2-epoxide hydrolase
MRSREKSVTRRNLVAAGAVGLAAVGFAQGAAAKESANETLVKDFLAKQGVSFDAMYQACADTFADDFVWIQSGIPDIKGRDAALAFMKQFGAMGIATVKIDVHHIASKGDIVFTERTDHMKRPDGSVAMSLPVTGVLTVQKGKIVRWADYYDPREALAMFSPKPPQK